MAENNDQLQEQTAQINCAKGCGFFGSASTMNMCSKCFREHEKTDTSPAEVPVAPSPPALMAVDTGASASAAASSKASIAALIAPSPSSASAVPDGLVAKSFSADSALSADVGEAVEDDGQPPRKVQKNTSRCFSCRKKIGLTGFQCRCDYFFCSEHRYSDKHECDYDYKSQGQELLQKANPVVIASKIDKI